MNITAQFAHAAPYYHHSGEVSHVVNAGMIATIIAFLCLLVVIAYVVTAFLTGRIFKKAGVESWKAWVPVYNNWILLELGGQKGFWAVLMLIPVVHIVATIFIYIAQYNIGLKLGKEGAFVLLAIFLPIIWLIWLAVDDSTWKKPRQPKKA